MALIRNIDESELAPVQMEGVSGAKMAVMIGRQDSAPHFALRQFTVDPGGYTPQHMHDYEHEVFIVSGSGTILLEGARHPIRGGDVIYVPANEEHQFRSDESGTEPLRFLCLVPVEQNCGGPVPGS
ncbi:MAG: cupin domain-containing protein [Phycisphaerales bacterium]|nr:cupin domain-containing protein [Phycisphaerales bacterium]